MTALAIIICIAAQFFLVAGQLFFKHAMNEAEPKPMRAKAGLLFIGIVSQAVWFFLWLGQLQQWDLSRIFPFEGLNPLLLVLGAWLILKEHLTIESWVGVALITAGLTLVAQ